MYILEKNQSFVKTITFAIIHFTVAFLVTFVITGSWVLGGLVATIEPICNTIAYFFHEKAWERFNRKDVATKSP
jgi:uncharacterized membrane protein